MAVSYVLPIFHADDSNGAPLVGGLLYTYANGTTTPAATYQDAAGLTPNTNPIVLDTRGEAVIFLTAGQYYTFVLKTSTGSTVWTQDDIIGPVLPSQLSGTAGWCSVSGTADAIALTPEVAIDAYAAGQRFSFIPLSANTSAVTVAVSGLSAKSLKRRDGATALVANDLVVGKITVIEYDGTAFQLLAEPLNSPLFTGSPKAPTQAAGDNSTNLATTAYVDRAFTAVAGGFRNLAISAVGTSASVAVSFDSLMLTNGTLYQLVSSGSLTINTASSGANGLDTGTLAGSTWYAVWVIAKADGTTSGLISTSATAPTMPADYTYKARVGWIRTDGTANKYPLSFIQRNWIAQYVVRNNVANLPIMASGVAGSTTLPTWAAVSVSNYVPSTASAIRFVAANAPGGTAQIMVAPNGNYGAYNSLTNPPPFSFSQAAAAATLTVSEEMMLESTNIYWANSASSSLACFGWVDNL